MTVFDDDKNELRSALIRELEAVVPPAVPIWLAKAYAEEIPTWYGRQWQLDLLLPAAADLPPQWLRRFKAGEEQDRYEGTVRIFALGSESIDCDITPLLLLLARDLVAIESGKSFVIEGG